MTTAILTEALLRGLETRARRDKTHSAAVALDITPSRWEHLRDTPYWSRVYLEVSWRDLTPKAKAANPELNTPYSYWIGCEGGVRPVDRDEALRALAGDWSAEREESFHAAAIAAAASVFKHMGVEA